MFGDSTIFLINVNGYENQNVLIHAKEKLTRTKTNHPNVFNLMGYSSYAI